MGQQVAATGKHAAMTFLLAGKCLHKLRQNEFPTSGRVYLDGRLDPLVVDDFRYSLDECIEILKTESANGPARRAFEQLRGAYGCLLQQCQSSGILSHDPLRDNIINLAMRLPNGARALLVQIAKILDADYEDIGQRITGLDFLDITFQLMDAIGLPPNSPQTISFNWDDLAPWKESKLEDEFLEEEALLPSSADETGQAQLE